MDGFAEKAKIYLGKSVTYPISIGFNENIGNLTLENIWPNDTTWKSFKLPEADVKVFHDNNQHVCSFYYKSEKAIRIVCTEKRYNGQTTKGVSVDDPIEFVNERYPFRRKEIPIIQDYFLVYHDLSLVFEIKYGKVHNWFLYVL